MTDTRRPTPTHRKPEPDDRAGGQQADEEDAALRNQQEGYGGPKQPEGRETPREVARKTGQLDD